MQTSQSWRMGIEILILDLMPMAAGSPLWLPLFRTNYKGMNDGCTRHVTVVFFIGENLPNLVPELLEWHRAWIGPSRSFVRRISSERGSRRAMVLVIMACCATTIRA